MNVRSGLELVLRAGLLVALAGGCVTGRPAGSGQATAGAGSPAASLPPAAVQPQTSARASDPLTPPSTPTPGPAVASDLLLTGALSGRVRNARSLGTCGRGPAGFAVALRFGLGSAAYVLSIDILDYNGAGRYDIPPERVAVKSDVHSAAPTFLPATSGAVDVAGDEASGKLDARLGGDVANHVQGTWACR